MNREGVMQMTDEQLRVKAAELMGWHWERDKTYKYVTGGSVIGAWVAPKGADYPPAFPAPTKDDIRNLPDYFDGIASAWELFDALVDHGHEPILETYRRKASGVRMYAVEVDVGQPVSSRCSPSTGYLDSAPRAITLAFIIAMG